jgi:hypothetical protein
VPVASSLPRVRELPDAPLAALVVDTVDVLARGVVHMWLSARRR